MLAMLATLVALGVLVSVLKKHGPLSSAITTTATTTTVATAAGGPSVVAGAPSTDTPNYFRVSIECPQPGGGYRFSGLVTTSAPGRLRVTMVGALGALGAQ